MKKTNPKRVLFASLLTAFIFFQGMGCDQSDPVSSGYAPAYLQSVNGPYTDYITDMEIDTRGWVYACSFNGAYVSKDAGASWERLGAGADISDARELALDRDGNVYAVTRYNNLYRLNGTGGKWLSMCTIPLLEYVTDIILTPRNTIIASGKLDYYSYAVMVSRDGGGSWSEFPLGNGWCLAVNSKGHVLASSNMSVFYSLDDGETWSRRGFFTADQVTAISIGASDEMYCGTHEGDFYYSSGIESNWSLISRDLFHKNIISIDINSEGVIFAGTRWGIYRSYDNGVSFGDSVLTSMPRAQIGVGASDEVYAFGDTRSGIYCSVDHGWTWRSTGFTVPEVLDVKTSGRGSLFVLSDGDGIFRTHDNGALWELVKELTWHQRFNAGFLFAASSGDVYYGSLLDGLSVIRDGADSWEGTGFNGSVYSLAEYSSGCILIGTDNGLNCSCYTFPEGECPVSGMPHGIVYSTVELADTCLLAGTGNGLYSSSDGGETWNRVSVDVLTRRVRGLYPSPAGTLIIYADEGLFRSQDGGLSLTRVSNAFTAESFSCLTFNDDGAIIAATCGGGIFLSEDDGISWRRLMKEEGRIKINSVAVDGEGRILIGADSGLHKIEGNY